MGKQLPILPATAQPTGTPAEKFIYSRVFCQKENPSPLRLMIDFLKSRGQLPILPSDMKEEGLDEWAWVHVDIPDTYTEQFGRNQAGGFIDLVQPIVKRPMLGFERATLNVAARIEYVDWNKDKFKSTGENISDEIFSLVPAISWRPTPQTVIRVNYRYNWQKDLLGNPPSKLAGIQVGLSTYF